MDDTVGLDPSSWAPWTHRPYCADTQYCVFTNSLFRGNHGVSIITTSEIAASSPDLLAKLTSGHTGASQSEIPYTVRDIPGKGKGLFATRRIERGQVFMEDYPSVLADVEFPGKVRRDQGQLLLQRAIGQLAQSEEVLSLARSSITGAPVQEDVMRTNTFGITVGERSRMALFPKISRINHACNPNAFTRFAESTLVNRVIAFRDIEPGEEITISYLEIGLPFEERQRGLRNRWGFQCTCELCSAAAADTETSDRRRERIRAVRQEVLGYVQRRDFHGAIKLNEELVGLIAKENMAPHLGEHYEVLARLYLAATDLKSAKKYARLALAELEANGGSDVYDSVDELSRLLEWH
ncbi:SET domain-containing protein [Coniochaeta ligniaria NRRL 30616]|uniref:SET domain-containing protein n=1 Tax=Coniochaeta ligniaria NRRL 30616 TaxID=1408157 RepID=A0A1J7JNL3_9PEZI|nr:SET domain-containing protein [Coniochaeta ligniaria NRRL 30616]